MTWACAAAVLACACVAQAEGADRPTFERNLPIRLDNSDDEALRHWPVTISVKSLRANAADFNADNCAVLSPDGREVAHQVDEIDPAVGPELSFLADLPANGTASYQLAYSPSGKRSVDFPPKTGTDKEWDAGKANIGWESNIGGYRTYYGQLDFFGKYTYEGDERPGRLIYPVDRKTSYHKEQPWGVDALHVGTTSGLGGVTLYVGDRPYLVQNPVGKGNVKLAHRVLTVGPVRAAVEVVAGNVVPDKPEVAVRLVCVIYAEHQESEIRASVTGAEPAMHLAPGLVKLAKEDRFVEASLGCVGAWGWQEDGIGEIGMAVVVPSGSLTQVVELDTETRLRCDLADGTLRYWIIGDWKKGRRDPAASTAATWREDAQALARSLHRRVLVTVE